jgi:hypothetical protein
LEKTAGPGLQSFLLTPFVFAIDLTVMASRVFRTELRDQTFSTLAMLPCGIRDIVHRKAWGCLLAAIPGAFCCLSMQIFGFIVSHASTPPVPNLSMHTLWGIQVVTGWLDKIFLTVLVAWLSLHMKRGALPTGWFLSFVGSMLVSLIGMIIITATSFAFSVGNPALFMFGLPVMTSVLGLFVSWILYFKGLQRLQSLAGEE